MKYEYRTITATTAELTRIVAPPAQVEIPEELDGYQIVAIGPNVIDKASKSTVKTVVIPPTVRALRAHAFNDLHYLKELQLNDGLLEIKEYGIFTCPDLTRLEIPSSLEKISTCAFGFMYEHGRAYKLNYFTLICEKDTAAYKFAVENALEFNLIED